MTKITDYDKGWMDALNNIIMCLDPESADYMGEKAYLDMSLNTLREYWAKEEEEE